ncbi:MAG: hypothetical protein M0R20_05090 [Candidatus Omnitrophica bacterium]|nr:hypothetical protein [Candidatus Omnitrophota bacterium]
MRGKTNLKYLAIVATVALLTGGGIFLYKQYLSEDAEDYQPLQQNEKNSSGYTIKESSGIKTVENTKEGLSMNIPADWQETPVSSNQIDFFSPEALEQTGIGEIKQGCKLTNFISDGKTDVKNLQNKFDSENQENQPISYKSEIIRVSGAEALKITVEEVPGIAIAVEAPVNEKLYIFIMYPGSQNIEKCTNAFNDFLETVSIGKLSNQEQTAAIKIYSEMFENSIDPNIETEKHRAVYEKTAKVVDFPVFYPQGIINGYKLKSIESNREMTFETKGTFTAVYERDNSRIKAFEGVGDIGMVNSLDYVDIANQEAGKKAWLWEQGGKIGISLYYGPDVNYFLIGENTDREDLIQFAKTFAPLK